MSTQNQVAVRVFRRSAELLQKGDIDGWLDLFAEDAVVEYPFAPPGRPSRVEGRAGLADHVRARAARIESPTVERLQIYMTDDPAVIVAEMVIRGTPSRPRPAIAVVTVHDGLITSYRDYYNPLDLNTGDAVPGTGS